jgi:hypothetical protein
MAHEITGGMNMALARYCTLHSRMHTWLTIPSRRMANRSESYALHTDSKSRDWIYSHPAGRVYSAHVRHAQGARSTYDLRNYRGLIIHISSHSVDGGISCVFQAL